MPEGFEETEDIVEVEVDDDGTSPDVYIESEEEAKDYVEEINETVDVFVEVDDIEDEDTTDSLKGNNYVLEEGVLSVYMTLKQPLSAYATVYSTEPEEKVEFKYNANGLRTQKKHYAADGSEITTDYTLHGKLITHLTKRVVDLEGVESSEELHFFYDAQSRPAMVEYNGAMYNYMHSLQGDIIGIVDAAGNLVVEYRYDAWGKPIYEAGSLLSTLGTLNPFRYRGYVWDKETELYYLRSRCYHPSVSRFICADSVLTEKQLMQNVFSYCSNKPIMQADHSGMLATAINLYLLAFNVKKDEHSEKTPLDFTQLAYQRSITPSVKNSATVFKRILNYIEKIPKGKNRYSNTESIFWGVTDALKKRNIADLDLALSVGTISHFKLTVERQQKNFLQSIFLNKDIYKVSYTIKDKYDFASFADSNRAPAVIFINDEFGYEFQKQGMLNSYWWTCSGEFTMYL